MREEALEFANVIKKDARFGSRLQKLALYTLELDTLATKYWNRSVNKEAEAEANKHVAEKLKEELAVLKEKCRWRKQSEEPAPKNEEVEIVTSSCNGKVLLCGRCIIDEDFWRPLDLPEEASE